MFDVFSYMDFAADSMKAVLSFLSGLAQILSSESVPDVFFKWGVNPGETNGAIDPERHGQKATFVHQVRIANLPNLYTDGSAVIQANTVYHGRPAIGDSDPFTLLP